MDIWMGAMFNLAFFFLMFFQLCPIWRAISVTLPSFCNMDRWMLSNMYCCLHALVWMAVLVPIHWVSHLLWLLDLNQDAAYHVFLHIVFVLVPLLAFPRMWISVVSYFIGDSCHVIVDRSGSSVDFYTRRTQSLECLLGLPFSSRETCAIGLVLPYIVDLSFAWDC